MRRGGVVVPVGVRDLMIGKSRNHKKEITTMDGNFAQFEAYGERLEARCCRQAENENWEWADDALRGSDLWELVENHIEESEYLPDTHEHVYQLDNGSTVIVDSLGDVLIGDSPDNGPSDLEVEAMLAHARKVDEEIAAKYGPEALKPNSGLWD